MNLRDEIRKVRDEKMTQPHELTKAVIYLDKKTGNVRATLTYEHDRDTIRMQSFSGNSLKAAVEFVVKAPSTKKFGV